MCFNISLHKDPGYIEDRFKVSFPANSEFKSFYHVSAISNPALPVISSENKGEVSFYEWGLIPYWVKDEKMAEKIRKKTVNARSESIFDKPSFKVPIKEKRCLVLADGFFEWREVKGKNYPYHIRLKDDEAFAFAGIWDKWHHPYKKKTVQTFSIITTKANPLLSKIHNKRKRMPVILERDNEKRWLNSDMSEEEVRRMLIQYDEDLMGAYPVKRLITKKDVDDDVPEIIEPYDYEELNFVQETLL